MDNFTSRVNAARSLFIETPAYVQKSHEGISGNRNPMNLRGLFFWQFSLKTHYESQCKMHISEGILSAPVLISGTALAAIGTAIGLKKLDYDRIPQAAILSAAFFVASLVRVPIGPSSVHLILNGLLGLLLGWVALPAILVALVLQALLFQYGGFTTLGVNAVIMGFPAVASFYVFRSGAKSEKTVVLISASFLCGAGAVFLATLILGFVLFLTGEQFLAVAKLVIFAHFPVMIIEGFITAFSIKFFKRVKPEILEIIYGR